MEEKRFFSRKSPRMPRYDYSTENYYFVTICTHEKRCLFGDPQRNNWLGALVRQHIGQIEKHYNSAYVDKYAVMPNHVHMILIIKNSGEANLAQIVGQFKSGVTREARNKQPNIEVWQRSFHDHVIRNQKQYEQIWTYIENNPHKWQEDCFYTETVEE